ncbi:MAG TPA: hypothetical protein PKC43_01880 [Phycisphaerales bacterium]|nr:hypothetical protein [Phycisphaerales bacterium]HMP36175.1 hypothetical protein [Phycisphaerales bacterium]
MILGASNVTRCAATVATTAIALRGHPIELLIAAGRGRSYGAASRVLARGLPSIIDSGLWPWLERGPRPTHALVTDVGNDILYGFDAETILGWVEICVQRLRDSGSAVAISRLPLARLERLGPRAFEIARLCLTPTRRRVPYATTMARIRAVDAGLAALALRFDATCVVPEGDWYGIDPVHVRWSRKPAAWRALLASWRDPAPSDGVETDVGIAGTIDSGALRSSARPRDGAAPKAMLAQGSGRRAPGEERSPACTPQAEADATGRGRLRSRPSLVMAARFAATFPQRFTLFGVPFGGPHAAPGTARIGSSVVRLF